MLRHVRLLIAFLMALSTLSSAQAPVPFINLPLVPDTISPGASQFTLTVNGTGFKADSIVRWNGSPLTTNFVNESQLTAIVPAAEIATASTAWVTVVNPGPGGGESKIAFFPVTDATSTVGFRRIDIGMGVGTSSGATGDLNGDGKLDLVMAKNHNDTVSVLLGNGDGTFQTQVDYPVGSPGSAPDSLVLGDFNGDGAPDIAVRNELVSTVSVLLGKGNGKFGSSVNYSTGNGFSNIVSGDFDGDGKLDLATTNSSDDTVSILLGKGDGTFQPRIDYASGTRPIPLAVGDVNGDGNLDLVVGHTYNSSFAVLLGNGNGTFESPRTYPTVDDPESVILADFDGDGKLDLAIFSEAGGIPGIEILLGNGDGTFRSLVKLPASCGDNFNVCVGATADINGDGNLDLVLRNSPADTVQVLLGNGDGTFQNPISFPTGDNPAQIVIGDFNGDGRLDFLVPNFYTTFASIFLQQTTMVSPTSLNFDSQLIRTESQPKIVILTNTGTAALDIAGIIASTGFQQNNNCPASLLPGKHCVIDVAFRPGGVGVKTGTLTISDNAPASPQIVTLNGVSTALSLSATDLNFGSQAVDTTSSAQTVTLTNHASTRTVAINKVLIKGGSFLSFAQTNTCEPSVAAGASCTLIVTFDPKYKGKRTSTLYIWDEGGDTPQAVTLEGDGT